MRNNVTIDWTENVRAQLRVLIKRILRKHGYPPDKQEKATPGAYWSRLRCCRWDGVWHERDDGHRARAYGVGAPLGLLATAVTARYYEACRLKPLRTSFCTGSKSLRRSSAKMPSRSRVRALCLL